MLFNSFFSLVEEGEKDYSFIMMNLRSRIDRAPAQEEDESHADESKSERSHGMSEVVKKNLITEIELNIN